MGALQDNMIIIMYCVILEMLCTASMRFLAPAVTRHQGGAYFYSGIAFNDAFKHLLNHGAALLLVSRTFSNMCWAGKFNCWLLVTSMVELNGSL